MSSKVIGVALRKPPRGASELSSSNEGDLLAIWHSWGGVSDEGGAKYHFAAHSPTWGWRGYRWGNQYGMPWRILPVAPSTVWAYTNKNYLMRLQIAQDGETIIAAKAKSDLLINANKNGCLSREEISKIRIMRLGEDGRLVPSTDFDSGIRPYWGQLLSDDAIAVWNSHKLVILSQAGEIVYQETTCGFYDYSRPFILRTDDNCLYYTDDPRRGWRRTVVFGAHQKCAATHGTAIFFTILGDACYVGIRHGRNSLALYCFSEKVPEDVEHVWTIDASTQDHCLARHSGLICIAARSPISGICGPHVPTNDGFLVWDPAINTFAVDTPALVHSSNINGNIGRHMPQVRIEPPPACQTAHR